MTLLRVLARSATGQDMTAYTTLASGRAAKMISTVPQNATSSVDNGRTGMLASVCAKPLRCIRCGACMNHCPVYNAVGGHAYGSVYPGPIGAVLTPALLGIAENKTICRAPPPSAGNCEAVCPVKIPLVSLMRTWRERAFEQRHRSGTGPRASRLWDLRRHAPSALSSHRPFRRRIWRASADRRAASAASFCSGWLRHHDLPAPRAAPSSNSGQKNQRGCSPMSRTTILSASPPHATAPACIRASPSTPASLVSHGADTIARFRAAAIAKGIIVVDVASASIFPPPLKAR